MKAYLFREYLIFIPNANLELSVEALSVLDISFISCGLDSVVRCFWQKPKAKWINEMKVKKMKMIKMKILIVSQKLWLQYLTENKFKRIL